MFLSQTGTCSMAQHPSPNSGRGQQAEAKQLQAHCGGVALRSRWGASRAWETLRLCRHRARGPETRARSLDSSFWRERVKVGALVQYQGRVKSEHSAAWLNSPHHYLKIPYPWIFLPNTHGSRRLRIICSEKEKEGLKHS